MNNLIIKVEKDSIAEELEIVAGDVLLKINNKEVKDVLDYRYLIKDEYLEVLVLHDGEHWLLQIDKDEDEDLGIVFESGLMDKALSCANKCIFCFVDQLPKGMRETLYFKDDDSRLSFLQGNYVTLTNVTDQDIERIIYYHLSPINISVHAFEPELRATMLRNLKAPNIKRYIDMLYKAGIEMNFQIVLCKDINDKEKLDFTIQSLSQYLPIAKSLSVVPVGITKFRESLYALESWKQQDCKYVIEQVESWQRKFKADYDTSFVFAADEFYLEAGCDIPSYESYENFPQIENGVGMISLFKYEFENVLPSLKTAKYKKISMITGKASYEFICSIAKAITSKVQSLKINVYCIENNFFGTEITVSGLLTGTDILEQLKSKDLGEILLVPRNALRANDTVFLDDVEISILETKLKTKTISVDNTAESLISAIS